MMHGASLITVGIVLMATNKLLLALKEDIIYLWFFYLGALIIVVGLLISIDILRQNYGIWRMTLKTMEGEEGRRHFNRWLIHHIVIVAMGIITLPLFLLPLPIGTALTLAIAFIIFAIAAPRLINYYQESRFLQRHPQHSR